MTETRIAAIVNVTPDSFSDGGAAYRADDAVEAVLRLLNEGADIVDIGAESTRPGATPVSPGEEWTRLAPVLAGLRGVPFGVDTRHAETAKNALRAGAHWINDVSGFSDPAMVAAVRDSACLLVVMHSLTVPADKNVVMGEADVVAALLDFARTRLDALEAAGIERMRLVFDPGIGFGKTAAQSWEIIRGIERFRELGVPLLIGHSRKSFLGEEDRDARTLDVSRQLMRSGVAWLRVHDVAAHAVLKEAVHV